jgi:hypothetical protein
MPATIRASTMAIAMASLGIAGAAAADDLDLTGTWRDETAQRADWEFPVLVTLPNGDERAHGTYLSLPYVEILRSKDGALHFYTDVGAMRAALRPMAGTPNTYDLVDLTNGANGNVLGVLRASTEACKPRPECFQLDPPPGVAPSGFPLPSGDLVFYVPIDPYDPTKDPKQDQTYGSNFAPVAGDNAYVTFCYDLRGLDTTDIQKNTGCRAALFMQLATDSYAYRKCNVCDANFDIPFSWTPKSAKATTLDAQVRTMETGRDFADSHSLDVGVNASANIFGFEASTSVDVATAQKIQSLTDSKSIVAHAETVTTDFALVLNRYYATPDPAFVTMIRNLKGKTPDDPAYDVVLKEWGTHYANAVTFGKRGFRTLTFDESLINTVRENKAKVAAALTIGYAGNTAGATVEAINEAVSGLKKMVGAEHIDTRCYGGSECPDGVPTGAGNVPIFLDLRPLSDLLAPPFFSDEEILGPIRENLSRLILKAAYVERNNLDTSTLNLVQVENPLTVLCGKDAVIPAAGPGAPDASVNHCCGLSYDAPPVLAALTLKGATDPLTRGKGGRPFFGKGVSISDGQLVSLPTEKDPAPIVSDATIDYNFARMVPRDGGFSPSVFAPNIDRYCQTIYGDGWTGTTTGQLASCNSGSTTQQLNVQDVCSAEAALYHSGASTAVWNPVEETWLCGFQTDIPVDVTSWCERKFGAGSEGHPYPVWVNQYDPRQWICSPGGNVSGDDICRDMAGRAFQPHSISAPDGDGYLLCNGTFAEVRKATGGGTQVLTYPDLRPYDDKNIAVGTLINVVVPLEWTGDSASVCEGVSLNLEIGLRKVGADALLSSP